MKATGIVRKMDDLGRIVIPMEMRRTLNIAEGDSLEVFVGEGGLIIFRKYAPGCTINGSQDDLINFEGKLYSREGIRQLAAAAGI